MFSSFINGCSFFGLFGPSDRDLAFHSIINSLLMVSSPGLQAAVYAGALSTFCHTLSFFFLFLLFSPSVVSMETGRKDGKRRRRERKGIQLDQPIECRAPSSAWHCQGAATMTSTAFNPYCPGKTGHLWSNTKGLLRSKTHCLFPTYLPQPYIESYRDHRACQAG